MVLGETLANLLRAGHLVKHAEAFGVGISGLKGGLVGIHIGELLHDVELSQRERGDVLVGDVHLHTLKILALAN